MSKHATHTFQGAPSGGRSRRQHAFEGKIANACRGTGGLGESPHREARVHRFYHRVLSEKAQAHRKVRRQLRVAGRKANQ